MRRAAPAGTGSGTGAHGAGPALGAPMPYRPLFALGLVLGLLGALVWIPPLAQALGVAPAALHPDLMIGGFLWQVAAGFLMTALPRFFGSLPAQRAEQLAAVGLGIALGAVSLMADRRPFHAVLLAQMLLVAGFGLRRARRRKVTPPPMFAFVALGLGCGLGGSALLLVSEAGGLGLRAAWWGRLLLYHGMMVALVLGVGSSLLTAMFGWAQPSLVKLGRPGELHGPGRPGRWREPGALLLLFALGLVLEGSGCSPAGGRALRALVVSWVALRAWRVLRRPRSPGWLVFWAWVGAGALVAGLWAQALLPGAAVHLVHLAFIAGLALMALMVAARVSLVHGGFGSAPERRSPALAGSGVLLVLAAAGRALAPAAGAGYDRHLAYAALVFAAALLLWSLAMLPRWLRPARGSAR